MKGKIKCILAVLMVLPLLWTLSSCSNDEPDTSSSQEIIDHIKSFILSDNGEVAFPQMPDQTGAYIIAVRDQAEAIDIYSTIFKMDEWDGTSRTVTISGAGTIKIEKDPMEGIFYVARFNVSGLPGITLYLSTEEYYKSQNFPIRVHNCSRCGFIINSHMIKKCPRCGCTDIIGGTDA